jgi:hypothetical protein
MSRTATIRRSLATSAALALVACGAAAVPAAADPGNGQGHGQGAGQGGQGAGQGGGAATAPGQDKDKDKGGKGHGQGHGQGHGHDHGHGQGGKGDKGDKGEGHGQGHGQGQGQGHGQGHGQGQDQGQGGKGDNGQGGGAGDPAGNNGTVKIAGLGELDGIPNNTPHPGCTFQVEWYGFDEGPDVVSQVSFAMHAPTSDVGLSVAGDTSVFVGADPASGAGTDTGLDGVETYTLTFDGEPHPKQGYHLKLTVATPRSQGNDTKSKVFWVEPCETTPVEEPVEEPGDETGDETVENGGRGSQDELQGQADQGVMGTTSEITQNQLEGAAADTAADAAEVPTRIDAGEQGALDSLADVARSPLALLIVGLGALVAVAGVLMRRRSSQLG